MAAFIVAEELLIVRCILKGCPLRNCMSGENYNEFRKPSHHVLSLLCEQTNLKLLALNEYDIQFTVYMFLFRYYSTTILDSAVEQNPIFSKRLKPTVNAILQRVGHPR